MLRGAAHLSQFNDVRVNKPFVDASLTSDSLDVLQAGCLQKQHTFIGGHCLTQTFRDWSKSHLDDRKAT